MPITKSTTIHVTKHEQNDELSRTYFCSSFIPSHQIKINSWNSYLPSTTCNEVNSIEKLTKEENLSCTATTTTTTTNTTNNKNVNFQNLNITKCFEETNELSMRIPYLFPVGWVPPPPHILLAYLQANKLLQRQQEHQCYHNEQQQSLCYQGQKQSIYETQSIPINYDITNQEARKNTLDLSISNNETMKTQFINSSNYFGKDQILKDEHMQSQEWVQNSRMLNKRKNDQHVNIEQQIITIQQDVIQLIDDHQSLLTTDDLKNHSNICEPTILQVIKQTKKEQYQVICSKPILSGTLLGPFCINECFKMNQTDGQLYINQSAKLLSISDTQTTIVDNSILSTLQNTTMLWMTLVRDISIQTVQNITVNTNPIQSNIMLISVIDNLTNNDNNINSVLLSNNSQFMNTFNQQNRKCLYYFKTQRYIHTGEELLLNEKNPLYDMYLLINANIKLYNSSKNSASRKIYTENNFPSSNLYSQYLNIDQNVTNLNKIRSNNLNLKNCTNNNSLYYVRKSTKPMGNDFTLQQQKVKDSSFNTSLTNSLNQSWNGKDNQLKLSGKRHNKETEVSFNEESIKSAFSHVSSPNRSSDYSLISSQANSFQNYATEYSNDDNLLKQSMNSVQGQLKSAHMIETSPAREGYTCDRCGKMFAYQYYRDKHLKYTRCMDQGDRKYPCKLCSRSFEKRDRLRIHVLHVHEKHRPHKCHLCGKNFSQSSSLNKHLRVHSGERPYKCCYCNKAFTASSILRTHIRQHSGEKPFKCKFCWKPFASHAAHDSHVRRTHSLDSKLMNINQTFQVNNILTTSTTDFKLTME
ncbi:unnamed protein product [Schistosoma turkestanicum]|nr:unnamed protein product [Schistosoma turkestanicum]